MYGALAGHLQRILPVCHTRADILWAYTRCWLESQVDSHLSENSDKGDLVSGLRLGQDAVASAQREHPEEVHRVVLDDVANFWPPSRYQIIYLELDLYPFCMHTPGSRGASEVHMQYACMDWSLNGSLCSLCGSCC